jgi:tripartite ATP-independent transporter DctP family solute receptor
MNRKTQTTPRRLFSPRLACRAGTSVLILAAIGCQPTTPASPQRDMPAETSIWRFAIEEAEGSVQHAYASRFKQMVQERTGGEVEVIIYPYGTLGTSTHITEQLNMGAIELAMASPGTLGKFIPELQVFLLHFVLPVDEQQTREILRDPRLLRYFDRLYAPKGLKLLSVFSEGEMVWTMNKEVRRPADFRGVKMRVMTSPLLLEAYRAYGASPTPMPYSEVYSGLQLNMIDGQVNPVFAIERQKFHEVTSWFIFPGHASFITTCAANRAFFDRLSPARKRIVQQVIAELDAYIFQVQSELQIERLKDILRDKKRKQSELTISGDLSRFVDSLTPREKSVLLHQNPSLRLVPELSAEQREAFRRASQQVRDVFRQIGGPRSDEVLRLLLSMTHE